MSVKILYRYFWTTLVILSVSSVIVLPVWSQEALPEHIKEWQEFALKMGKPEISVWAKRLADPEGIKLGKTWAEFLGYDAPSLVKASDPAPEIKPGAIITPKNLSDYPGLKKLLPPEIYDMFTDKNFPITLGKITVCPTNHYYPSAGKQKAARRYEGKAKLEGINITNWTAGCPFPHIDSSDPDIAVKLWHNLDVGISGTDDWEDDPVEFRFFNKKNKQHRTQITHLRWKMYTGRTDIEPIPTIPGTKYRERGGGDASAPYDIAGMAFIKTRYLNPKVSDDFVAYVPSLRRIRVLSGSDTQDPLFGSDCTWDDWRSYWQKCSDKIWPIKLKYLGETVALVPVKGMGYQMEDGNKLMAYWEKRPCWIIEITTGSGYIYGKRITYVDKEMVGVGGFHILTDARLNFWKTTIAGGEWWPEHGKFDWRYYEMIDYINQHRSWLHFQPVLRDKMWDDKWLSIRFLARQAR